jgi:hypothetical protein
VEARKKRSYHWFVEPLDANTNAAISKLVPEVDEIVGMHDEKDTVRNVYRINGRQLSMLQSSKTQIGLKFNVYVQEGNGKIRSFNLPSVKRKKREVSARQRKAA